MDTLHLLLQSLTITQKPAIGLQQLHLRKSHVTNAASAGRDSLMHVTSLVLLQMSGATCSYC
jgi:hypothetical protein